MNRFLQIYQLMMPYRLISSFASNYKCNFSPAIIKYAVFLSRPIFRPVLVNVKVFNTI